MPFVSDRPAAVARSVLRSAFIRFLAAFALGITALPAFAAVDLVVNNIDTGYDPTPAGGVVQYTVRIDNNGNSGATGVTLSDTLPSSTTFVSSSATQGSCTAPAGGVLSCDLGSLDSLGSATVLVRVRALAAGYITNTATATANEPDTDSSNNTNIQQSTTISQGADLQLSATASASSVPSGSSLSYSFSVRNGGPDTASSVQLSANLPPGFVVSGGLPAGCSVSGQVLTCTLSSSIASGSVIPIGPISGTVTAASGSTLTLSSSVSITSSSAAQDPDTSNNSATVNTAVTSGSDVRLSMSSSTGSPVLVGSTFNFVLASSFSGDNPANLVLTDTLPSNYQILNAASFSSNGWACTVSGQTVRCTRSQGGSAAGSNVSIGNVTVQVRAVTAGNGVTNVATISSDTPDNNTANNTAQVTLNIVNPTADLSASKAGPNPALATAGSNWTWTVSARNNGTAALTGTVQLTDTVPVGVTVQAYTATNGWSCAPTAPFTASSGNQTLTCSREYTAASPLASGAWTPQVSYTASATTATSYTNTVCVSAAASANGTPPPDGNTANDCASHVMQVQTSPNSANLRLSKAASPATVPAGDVLTYTLEIVNAGPNTATNVSLTDALDNLINSGSGATGQGFVGATIAAGNSSGGSCTSSASGSTTRNLSCSIASIPTCTAGSNCPVITVQVRPGGDGGTRTNTANVSSADVADPDYADNTASASSQVDPRADVTVTATATPSPVAAGQNLTYVLTVRNAGPSTAQTVQLSNTLPLNLTFLSATASGGGSCSTQPAANSTTTSGNNTLSCNWASIGNGAQQTLTLLVRPNTATRGTTLVDDASVSTATTESNTANNTGSVSVSVGNPALDLLANVVDNPDPVAVGDTMQYTYTVTNRGPSYAENVTLTATLPAALLSYAALTAPSGVSCTAPAVGSYGGTVTCNMGGLPANASASVNVQLLGTAKGTTTTSLTVASDETRAGFDTLPSNNTATEQTTVRNKADVAVTAKTATPATIGLNEPFQYTITVTNNGPGAADAVVLSDNLPSGMVLTVAPSVAPGNAADFPSLPATPCSGSAGSTSFTCNLGDTVAAGATARIVALVKVVAAPSTNPGTLTNTATITTSSKDEQAANNSASGAVTVQTASLSGRVYVDANNNAAQDAGEAGIAGVTVRLTGTAPDGTAISRTATTAADGSYSFTGLPAGTYTLAETQPATWFDGRDTAGSAGGTLTPPDTISAITLTSQTAATGYLFGELAGASLSGLVYVDTNRNGVHDASETTGIPGVTLTLTGTDDLGAAVNRTTTTAANGSYLFDNLRPGNYTVTETQPAQWHDGGDSVGTVAGSPRGTAGNDTVTGIALQAGDVGVNYNFGEIGQGLSGLVYVDSNGNGLHDNGEPGIAGVTVTATNTGTGVAITQTTDASGAYVFADLPAGTYTLAETQPAGYADGAEQIGSLGGTSSGNDSITGIVLGTGQIGTQYNFGEIAAGLSGAVFLDANGNGVRDPGEGLGGVTITLTGTDDLGAAVSRTVLTQADGSYAFTGLRPGTYTLTETQPAGYGNGATRAGSAGGSVSTNQIANITLGVGAAATGYDFIEQGGSLSGLVYLDRNDNGTFDSGDTGLAGVVLTLGGDANRTTTTAADGSYSFTGLTAGNYTITETQPTLYQDGKTQPGSAGGSVQTNAVVGIPLAAGAQAAGYDFGERIGAPGAIAGSVWLNTPGGNATAQDAGEHGLQGWTVTLLQNGQPVPGVAAVQTDADGHYLLRDVPAGSGYTVRFTSPNGAYLGYPVSQDPNPQWNGTVDRGAAIPAIAGITVGSGVTVTQQNLPIDPSGVVYDSVTRTPLAGAVVTLLGPNGQPVDPAILVGGSANVSQTTGADGFYQFLLLSNAPAGTYTLQVQPPPGYLPPPSGIHPPAGPVLTPPAGSGEYAVSSVTGPPASGPLPPYYLAINLGPNIASVVGNHIPLDPVLAGALTVRKTTPKVNVLKAELVPYTITVTNTLNSAVPAVAVRDRMPPGFKYRQGSARVDGVAVEPQVNGRELTWSNLQFSAQQTRTIQLVLTVGIGVGEAEYVNQAWAINTVTDGMASNLATAAVRVVPDATFDCADLIGKVFDDRNANGVQDPGEPGLPGIRLINVRGLIITTDAQGRYHVPCAATPNLPRGENFVLKLDERSLPTGYRLTTDNPGDVRLTAGKMAKLNFGATIHRVVRLDLGAAAFAKDGDTLLPRAAQELGTLFPILRERPSVLRLAYHLQPGEPRQQAERRLQALRQRIAKDWTDGCGCAPLPVETEIVEGRP